MIILLSFKATEAFAENEVVKRFNAALTALGEEVIIADPDHKNISTHEPIAIYSHKIKFAISLHITIPPVPGIINYLCVWDPFVWRNNLQDLTNLLQYDDYLLIETAAIIDPIRELLKNCVDEKLLNFNYLPPTTSRAYCIPPVKNSQRRLFYCGICGDKEDNQKTRLRTILKDIDNANVLDIYGPEKIKAPNGEVLFPWANYLSYRGSIPFDGYSLLSKMHVTGISLVISSNNHRKYGIPSARIFEACASGNIIIADNNAYFSHWGNSIYTVDFSLPSNKVSEKLLQCINEINQDPQSSLLKAQQSQTIFVNNHCLEIYFEKILGTHSSRSEFQLKFSAAKNNCNNIKDIIYSYLTLKKVEGFLGKGKYLADKYNLQFLYKLNELRKKIRDRCSYHKISDG